MSENNNFNKYDINDVLYAYNSKANRIDRIVVTAITLYPGDEEIKYNYIYYQHEVFAFYKNAFEYARQCLNEHYKQLEEELKNNSKGGEGNASS